MLEMQEYACQTRHSLSAPCRWQRKCAYGIPPSLSPFLPAIHIKCSASARDRRARNSSVRKMPYNQ